MFVSRLATVKDDLKKGRFSLNVRPTVIISVFLLLNYKLADCSKFYKMFVRLLSGFPIFGNMTENPQGALRRFHFLIQSHEDQHMTDSHLCQCQWLQ